MRETVQRSERVRFVCDNTDCEKEEIVMFQNRHPDVPVGWFQFIAHDAWIGIEGKHVTAGIEIQACCSSCFYAALEELIDETLDKEP